MRHLCRWNRLKSLPVLRNRQKSILDSLNPFIVSQSFHVSIDWKPSLDNTRVIILCDWWHHCCYFCFCTYPQMFLLLLHLLSVLCFAQTLLYCVRIYRIRTFDKSTYSPASVRINSNRWRRTIRYETVQMFNKCFDRWAIKPGAECETVSKGYKLTVNDLSPRSSNFRLWVRSVWTPQLNSKLYRKFQFNSKLFYFVKANWFSFELHPNGFSFWSQTRKDLMNILISNSLDERCIYKFTSH